MCPHLQCSRPPHGWHREPRVRRRHSAQAAEQPSSHSHTHGMSCRARSGLCGLWRERPSRVCKSRCPWLPALSACVSVTSEDNKLHFLPGRGVQSGDEPVLRPRHPPGQDGPLSPCLSSADHLPELPAHPNQESPGQSGSGPAAPPGTPILRGPGRQLQAGGRDCECLGRGGWCGHQEQQWSALCCWAELLLGFSGRVPHFC